MKKKKKREKKKVMEVVYCSAPYVCVNRVIFPGSAPVL